MFDWTTIISSAIVSAINGVVVFLSVRFMSKAVDKLEKGKKKGNNKE